MVAGCGAVPVGGVVVGGVGVGGAGGRNAATSAPPIEALSPAAAITTGGELSGHGSRRP